MIAENLIDFIDPGLPVISAKVKHSQKARPNLKRTENVLKKSFCFADRSVSEEFGASRDRFGP